MSDTTEAPKTVEEINAHLAEKAAATTTEPAKTTEPTTKVEAPVITHEVLAQPSGVSTEKAPETIVEPTVTKKVEVPIIPATPPNAAEAPVNIDTAPEPSKTVEQTTNSINSTGVTLKEPSALKNAAGPVAQSSVPAGHSNVVNPATGVSHNVFSWFYLHVVSQVKNIPVFVEKVFTDTNSVVGQSEQSAAYKAASAAVLKSATALAVAAGVTVAEKGINPSQDISTAALLENLVFDVHNYISILESEYKVAA